MNVDEWVQVEAAKEPDGSWRTMMGRVAQFHHKHDFASPENNGHDMGYRLALVIEELGELSAAITKGKPKEEAAEELENKISAALRLAAPRYLDEIGDAVRKLEQTLGESGSSPFVAAMRQGVGMVGEFVSDVERGYKDKIID